VLGATARFTLLANIPTSVTLGGGKKIAGVTAYLNLAAGVPTSVSITGGKISATGNSTAQMFLTTAPGSPVIGAFLLGDLIAAPFTMTGLSGSQTLNFTTYSISAADPGGTSLATAWYSYTPPYPGTFTLTVPSGTEVYLVNPNSSDPYEAYQAGPSTVTYVASSLTYLCWGALGTKVQTPTFTWSFAATVTPMSISVYPTVVQQTPTSVLVTLSGGPASTVVTFAVQGYGGSTSIATDSAGTITGASMSIPAVPAGTALITATSGASTANCSLSVRTAPPSRPTTLVADAAPTLIAQSGAVVKWVLFDPAPGGTTYTMPINPSSWTSPHAPRNVMVESTTQGNPIMWEGAIRSHGFTFSGYLDAQATYDALEAFRDLNHRFWIADHRNRAWVCSIDAIDWTPKRVPGKPWAHNYVVRAQVYKGPVAL